MEESCRLNHKSDSFWLVLLFYYNGIDCFSIEGSFLFSFFVTRQLAPFPKFAVYNFVCCVLPVDSG